MRNLFIPNGMQAGKMLSFAGTESQMFMTTTVLCTLKIISKKKKKKNKSGCSVWDCINSGVRNSVFSISILLRLFLLVYGSFLLKWFFFVGRKQYFIRQPLFYFQLFRIQKSTTCYSLDPNKVIEHSAFFQFAKFRKLRFFKYFQKNLKIFWRTESSAIPV